MSRKLAGGLILGVAIAVGVSAFAPAQDLLDPERDLLDVEITDYDRSNAIYLVRQHDRDSDRVLSKAEMSMLNLMLPVSILDFNHNGRLTSLELSIYFANASVQLGISTTDSYNARYLINRHDRDANGALTEQELSAFPYRRDQQDIDRDRDAALTAFELAAWFARAYREKGIDARDFRLAATYLEKLDANDDLQLSKAEAEPGIWPIDPWKLDRDRDQQLEATEIASVFSDFKREAGVENGHEQGADRAMKRYDKNRDGRLDIGEIERGGWPRDWQTFDANEDGELTSFELSARFAAKQRSLGVDRTALNKAEELIRRYDRNRNGLVDIQELLEFRADVGALDTDTFVRLDTDGNQKLSKVELAVRFANERSSKDE